MKKIIMFFLTLVIMLGYGTVIVSAATVKIDFYTADNISSENGIEISNDVLNTASKQCKEYDEIYEYNVLLIKNYSCHIYHFKPSKKGWYAFYTTGNSDTEIKVYQSKKSWSKTYYDTIGSSVDGCLIDKYKNASLRYECEKNKDYYVCVRLKGKSTGYYNLKVAPNLDLISPKYDSSNLWRFSDHSNVFRLGRVDERLYLTKYEVILLYWALSMDNSIIQDANGNTYSVDKLCDLYDDNYEKAISYATTILGILCSIYEAPVIVSVAISTISIIYDYYENYLTTSTSKMKRILSDKCGAKCELINCKKDANSFTTTYKWTANNGIIIETVLGLGFMPVKKYYVYKDGSNRYGFEYNAGEWCNG